MLVNFDLGALVGCREFEADLLSCEDRLRVEALAEHGCLVMPGALQGPLHIPISGSLFLMSEVPLYRGGRDVRLITCGSRISRRGGKREEEDSAAAERIGRT